MTMHNDSTYGDQVELSELPSPTQGLAAINWNPLTSNAVEQPVKRMRRSRRPSRAFTLLVVACAVYGGYLALVYHLGQS